MKKTVSPKTFGALHDEEGASWDLLREHALAFIAADGGLAYYVRGPVTDAKTSGFGEDAVLTPQSAEEEDTLVESRARLLFDESTAQGAHAILRVLVRETTARLRRCSRTILGDVGPLKQEQSERLPGEQLIGLLATVLRDLSFLLTILAPMESSGMTHDCFAACLDSVLDATTAKALLIISAAISAENISGAGDDFHAVAKATIFFHFFLKGGTPSACAPGFPDETVDIEARPRLDVYDGAVWLSTADNASQEVRTGPTSDSLLVCANAAGPDELSQLDESSSPGTTRKPKQALELMLKERGRLLRRELAPMDSNDRDAASATSFQSSLTLLHERFPANNVASRVLELLEHLQTGKVWIARALQDAAQGGPSQSAGFAATVLETHSTSDRDCVTQPRRSKRRTPTSSGMRAAEVDAPATAVARKSNDASALDIIDSSATKVPASSAPEDARSPGRRKHVSRLRPETIRRSGRPPERNTHSTPGADTITPVTSSDIPFRGAKVQARRDALPQESRKIPEAPTKPKRKRSSSARLRLSSAGHNDPQHETTLPESSSDDSASDRNHGNEVIQKGQSKARATSRRADLETDLTRNDRLGRAQSARFKDTEQIYEEDVGANASPNIVRRRKADREAPDDDAEPKWFHWNRRRNLPTSALDRIGKTRVSHRQYSVGMQLLEKKKRLPLRQSKTKSPLAVRRRQTMASDEIGAALSRSDRISLVRFANSRRRSLPAQPNLAESDESGEESPAHVLAARASR